MTTTFCGSKAQDMTYPSLLIIGPGDGLEEFESYYSFYGKTPHSDKFNLFHGPDEGVWHNHHLMIHVHMNFLVDVLTTYEHEQENDKTKRSTPEEKITLLVLNQAFSSLNDFTPILQLEKEFHARAFAHRYLGWFHECLRTGKLQELTRHERIIPIRNPLLQTLPRSGLWCSSHTRTNSFSHWMNEQNKALWAEHALDISEQRMTVLDLISSLRTLVFDWYYQHTMKEVCRSFPLCHVDQLERPSQSTVLNRNITHLSDHLDLLQEWTQLTNARLHQIDQEAQEEEEAKSHELSQAQAYREYVTYLNAKGQLLHHPDEFQRLDTCDKSDKSGKINNSAIPKKNSSTSNQCWKDRSKANQDTWRTRKSSHFVYDLNSILKHPETEQVYF
ncbi:MAG: hypothetical protein Sylvanvirus1_25 [Sylvanvirus sp.]|uniref:Uncharacterized protein n=1 Tax=Sylvanvirus sp. TaxID=2487774 RepID=A0A3G5AKJ8_9VIRU|nr:MAG: hypothetical protein Sylvanvirus1_25 [Sylvanvirus sp.]